MKYDIEYHVETLHFDRWKIAQMFLNHFDQLWDVSESHLSWAQMTGDTPGYMQSHGSVSVHYIIAIKATRRKAIAGEHRDRIVSRH